MTVRCSYDLTVCLVLGSGEESEQGVIATTYKQMQPNTGMYGSDTVTV